MRTLFTLLLATLILACPFVCGAEEIGHGVRHEHAAGESGEGSSPAHCPESGDNCVCQGAVQASGVRVPPLDAVLPCLHAFAPDLFAAHPLRHHLTWEGSPTGLAGWGDSLTIRALLQNFRF